MEELYKGYVVDASLLSKDPHLSQGCVTCHRGDAAATEGGSAHAGLVKRPSDDPATCSPCHPDIGRTYSQTLHFTTAGLRNGLMPRLSADEGRKFDSLVFEQSCRSCHASCGDCHVRSPTVSGLSAGLMEGHKFVRKDDAKTCSLCHGGRVYPEFTGDYGGNVDIHYQKGMTCTDCHLAAQLHGSGATVADRRSDPARPTCSGCHAPASMTTDAARDSHAAHGEKVSCSACHSSSEYRGCTSCHLGEGARSEPMFVLGRNPRKPEQLTTLRLVPTLRDTFVKAGIAQATFDALPNLWDTVPHNTKKRTERTRDCSLCHGEQAKFLSESGLPSGGSEANKALIFKF